MIDLHCHLLAGLDDGPPTVEASVELAAASFAAGIDTIAATPHIRADYPFPLDEIERATADVRAGLQSASVGVTVVRGAEVALSEVSELDHDMLVSLCLGRGPYILMESPYAYAGPEVESVLSELQSRGFRPLLAHPERSPTFMREPDRLATLVASGVVCSVPGASMRGDFGRTVKRFTRELFLAGLVHNVASDAHDVKMRRPGLLDGFETLEAELPGLVDSAAWFVRD